MKHIKKFIEDEPKIAITLTVGILLVFFWVITNRMPELFIFGSEIMTLALSIGVSLVTAITFYIFQFYIQAVKIRKIADQEFRKVLARILSILTDIYISCSTKEEIDKNTIESINNFLSEETALKISQYFDMEKEANHIPKTPWANKLAMMANETKEQCNTIACKYSPYLKEHFLESLYEIESDPMIEYFRTLNNWESLLFQKKYYQRTFLPGNLLWELFKKIRNINKQNQFNLKFSRQIFEVQKGLLTKARIRIKD